LAILVVLVVVAPGDAHATQWKGYETSKDGVRHVINPMIPIEGSMTYEGEKTWRIGGDDDAEVLFGQITHIVRDKLGFSYILDSQLCTVHIMAPDGEYLRSIGRAGEGPGEFRVPNSVSLFSSGTVCVLQVMPGRAVLLTPDGEATGEHPLPRGKDDTHVFINGGVVVNDRLIINMAQFIRKETSIGLRTSFVRIDSEGKITTTYWEQLQEQDLAKVTFDEKADAMPVWAAGSDGRFYVNNDWDRYHIEVIDSEGAPIHVVERDYEHRKRTPRDFEHLEKRKESGDISPATKTAETSRDVVRIIPRDNGELWVLSSRGEKDVPNGIVGMFDVFNRSGRYVRQVSVRGPYRPGRDGFRLVEDYVYVITNVGEFAGIDQAESTEEDADDIGQIEVICLKLLAK
jgi:hypothetical protein